MQVVSCFLGYFFYKIADIKINLILTTFVLLPIVAITFAAAFGIWASNDYKGYSKRVWDRPGVSPEEQRKLKKASYWEQ